MVGGDWAAVGRLYPPLGLLGLAMNPRSASRRPKHHAFHVVLSMGPIVLDMNSHGWQNSFLKSDQSAKSGNDTANG